MKKTEIQDLTTPMFYVLMALLKSKFSIPEIKNYIYERTKQNIKIKKRIIHIILQNYEVKGIVEQVISDSNDMYAITEKGRTFFQNELKRLKLCIEDKERGV